jgi:L-Ala-D/L-Glu epimerase
MSLKVEARELELAQRFTIARETWDVASNVFVTVTLREARGIGEASPDPHWGESVDSVVAQLEGVDLEALAGPFDLEGISELLPAGAARCALDVALHDLAGKVAGVSVAELLGVGGRPLPPTSVTLGIDAPEVMRARAQDLADHPVLKMKVGFDGDVDVVASIRDVYRGTLRIDANEGWDAPTAIDRLGALAPFDIELCEQPIPAGDHDSLRAVTQATSIPVFADEDVATASDVAALAGVVDGVNLKLRKAGGIRETIAAIHAARALGLRVMLGCDLESSVAATAQAQVAPLVDHADLDGPLILADDPYRGVAYDKGQMRLPGGPGLGVSPAR